MIFDVFPAFAAKVRRYAYGETHPVFKMSQSMLREVASWDLSRLRSEKAADAQRPLIFSLSVQSNPIARNRYLFKLRVLEEILALV